MASGNPIARFVFRVTREGTRWGATVEGTPFEAASEEELRAAVQDHLLDHVATETGERKEDLRAGLAVSWTVTVRSVSLPPTADEDAGLSREAC